MASCTGGYDCDFVTAPDDSLYCKICLGVARDPRQHGPCGQLFCDTCLESSSDSCPWCRMPNSTFFPDKRSHRQIQSLTVACENKQDGCYWRGDLSSLKGHLLGKCLYRPTECPYCNCMLKMINIESHKRKVCMSRPYSCSYCGEKNSYRYIKHWHNPVTCPNSGCRELVCSAMLKDHVAMECDFSLVDCECKEIGCKEQLMRKDMVQHENSHLKDLLKENSELKKYVAYLEMDTDRRKEEYQESVSHLKMDLDRQKEDNQALQEQMNAIIRKMYKQDYYYLITLFLVVISSLILMDFFNVL